MTPEWYIPDIFNAFAFPVTPVIPNDKTDAILGFSWGLIPPWAKDTCICKNTLNARLETLDQKSSFKPTLSKRCLVPADDFYEWKWLDPKEEFKQKYLLTLPGEELTAYRKILQNRLNRNINHL
ncbi:SOS response-associated peptidase family protein [Marinilabilia sp.]|uniref:SOS response-associated peptidase family protein n=1 Tax=Marinilabilia sp. TaxID=2021252 RepID=UPI00345DC57D